MHASNLTRLYFWSVPGIQSNYNCKTVTLNTYNCVRSVHYVCVHARYYQKLDRFFLLSGLSHGTIISGFIIVWSNTLTKTTGTWKYHFMFIYQSTGWYDIVVHVKCFKKGLIFMDGVHFFGYKFWKTLSFRVKLFKDYLYQKLE